MTSIRKAIFFKYLFVPKHRAHFNSILVFFTHKCCYLYFVFFLSARTWLPTRTLPRRSSFAPATRKVNSFAESLMRIWRERKFWSSSPPKSMRLLKSKFNFIQIIRLIIRHSVWFAPGDIPWASKATLLNHWSLCLAETEESTLVHFCFVFREPLFWFLEISWALFSCWAFVRRRISIFLSLDFPRRDFFLCLVITEFVSRCVSMLDA